MSGPGLGICCAGCRRTYVPLKNDIRVIETLADGSPYKLWCADLIECPGCHHRIVSGFGNRPIAEHFESDFKQRVVEEAIYMPLFTIDGTRYAMRNWDGETN